MSGSFRSVIIISFLLTLFAGMVHGLDTGWIKEISTVQDFESISVPDDSRADLLRTTKFLAPASDNPDLLQTVYQKCQ